MENATVECPGGIAAAHQSSNLSTNLQRSRSIPEPISDSHDLHNQGTQSKTLFCLELNFFKHMSNRII